MHFLKKVLLFNKNIYFRTTKYLTVNEWIPFVAYPTLGGPLKVDEEWECQFAKILSLTGTSIYC